MCLKVDNASSNDIGVDMFKSPLKLLYDRGNLHVRCSYILDMVVEDDLKDIDKVIFKSEINTKKEMENDNGIRKFAKFEKYWPILTLIPFRAILDLPYKFQFSKWTYTRIYKYNHEIEPSLLIDNLFALLTEYVKSSILVSLFQSLTYLAQFNLIT
ncbi:hypothetical protein Cgig2_015451 [Carnegiea gigantea]|uniref:Uncharacterized protein n=1 Tax=Carnegiea gigantea TaxID=171969 RepID=A0A9Q1JXS2_9CARY|nr:hypothetical protein Cgig2_015451 [Carnegiea gigantea]